MTNSAGSVVSDAATLSIGERLKHAYFYGSSTIIFLLGCNYTCVSEGYSRVC